MKHYQCQNHIRTTLCLFSILCVSCLGTVGAGTLTWTNAAGGNWNVAENWDPNQVPAAGDTAAITNSGNYTVTVDSDFHSLDTLILGGSTGGQTLAVSGGQLSCTGTLTVGAAATLNISLASLQAPQVNIAGSLAWNSGSIAGGVNIAPGGTLYITGYNDKFLDEGAAITNY